MLWAQIILLALFCTNLFAAGRRCARDASKHRVLVEAGSAVVFWGIILLAGAFDRVFPWP